MTPTLSQGQAEPTELAQRLADIRRTAYCQWQGVPPNAFRTFTIPESTLDALDRIAARSAAPPGWKLVPIKPTEAMLLAGGESILRSNGCHRASATPDESDCSQAESAFYAMVAAVAAPDAGKTSK